MNHHHLTIYALIWVSASAQSHIPQAYHYFAARHAVPSDVLFAVCLQESGKPWEDRHLPWPWTLNIEGKGFYFDTHSSAYSKLYSVVNIGSCRVDIGICQVNWCAHKKQFSDPVQLLNPYVNLDYAARLIRAEYEHTVKQGKPDWWAAVGRYHSPGNPKLAQHYSGKVHTRWQKLAPSTVLVAKRVRR